MTQEKIKILIADDHTLFRQGLRRILEAEPDISVVGEAATGLEAVRSAKQIKPDIVIMDILIPEQDGIESMRQILKSAGGRVLILTMQLEHHVISEAVSAGASGYLTKNSLDHELISAVRTVVHGDTVLSPIVSKRLAESTQMPGSATTAPRSLDLLTSREREVFVLLAEGKTPTEVANSLFVSPKTVHTHRQHIMEKLGVRTTTELIRFALRRGVIKTV